MRQRLRRIARWGITAYFFDLRFLTFRADPLIKKSSSIFPSLIAATSHRGLAPRPAQVSPEGLRYFGGTFMPLMALTRRLPRAPVPRPTDPIESPRLSNCL
jgi:hypothetical protein